MEWAKGPIMKFCILSLFFVQGARQLC